GRRKYQRERLDARGCARSRSRRTRKAHRPARSTTALISRRERSQTPTAPRVARVVTSTLGCRAMPDADRSDEARASYRRAVEARETVHRGEARWSVLAEQFFTEDAVFVDPAWGRTEGRPAIAQFLDESMAGLDSW